MVFRLDSRHAGFAEEFETLLGSKREVSEGVSLSVATILEDVRARGDEAVLAYTDRFDKLPLTATTMAFSADEIDAADAAISCSTCSRVLVCTRPSCPDGTCGTSGPSVVGP